MATPYKFCVNQARRLKLKENKEKRSSGSPDVKWNNTRNQKNVGKKCWTRKRESEIRNFELWTNGVEEKCNTERKSHTIQEERCEEDRVIKQ
jgi:hypothetical protein